MLRSLAVLLLVLPQTAFAIPVHFFVNLGTPPGSSAPPSPDPLILEQEGLYDLNLWADPTRAAGGGVFGIQDVRIAATGSIAITDFVCDSAANCLKGAPADPGREAFFTAGDDINGEFATFRLATLKIRVGPGRHGLLSVVGGTALDAQFEGGLLDVHEVLVAVPEASTAAAVALGAGILGAAYRRRVS